MNDQIGSSAIELHSICIHASANASSVDSLWCAQAATDKGSQVLWDLKAPEMLRKG